MGANNPFLLSISAHILYIGIVDMYLYIVLCRWVVYPPTVHSPSLSGASPMGGYTHLPSGFRQGFLPISHWATHLWNIFSSRRRHGAKTHVSNHNIRTDCTTALWNIPGIFESAPSRPKMQNSLVYLFCTLLIFFTTISSRHCRPTAIC